MELDTKDWPREILEHLINASCEQDVSVNDVINDLLLQWLESNGYYDDELLSDEEFAESMREDLERAEYGSTHEEFAESMREDLERAEYGSTHEEFAESFAEEHDDGLAFLPMAVFTKINRIADEYDSRKKTLGSRVEPNLQDIAKFLSISYGTPFTETQVRAVIELKKKGAQPTMNGELNLNFHQYVQNIIFGFEELEEKLNRPPSVWELTDALNEAGITVERHQVSSIIEINKERCKNKKCSKKCERC